MKSMDSARRRELLTTLLHTVKGGAAGTVLSLCFVLVFALAVKLFQISDTAITVVNQILRVLSVLFAVWFTLRQTPDKGWLKGLLAGLFYAAFTLVVFSLIDGIWAFGWPLVMDLAIGAGSGVVGGILLVNLRRK